MLAVAPGAIGVGTVQNIDVPVEVKVLDCQPNNNFDDWDHVEDIAHLSLGCPHSIG